MINAIAVLAFISIIGLVVSGAFYIAKNNKKAKHGDL